MKKILNIALSIATLIIFSSYSSFAADNAANVPVNIAVLDIEKIAKEAKAVHDIQNKVAKKQDEFQKEIDKKNSELQSDQKKLESKKNILSKEAMEKEQKSFEKKVDTLKTLVEKKQASLKKASTDSMIKVNDKMKDIIAEIAKEKGLTLIVPSSQVVFAIENLDITAEVLEKLDKKITKVEVKFE